MPGGCRDGADPDDSRLPQALTLPQAVAIAIQNHPRIAAAQNTESAAGQRITQARAPYYPAVSGEITGSQANSLSRVGAGFLTTSSSFTRQGEGMEVNQLITDLGENRQPGGQCKTASAGLRADDAGNPLQRYSRGEPRVLRSARNRRPWCASRRRPSPRAKRSTIRLPLWARPSSSPRWTSVSSMRESSEAKLLFIRAQSNLQQSFVDLARALGQDAAPPQYQLTEVPRRARLRLRLRTSSRRR